MLRLPEIARSDGDYAGILPQLHGGDDFFDTDGGGAENSPAKLLTHAGMINLTPAADLLGSSDQIARGGSSETVIEWQSDKRLEQIALQAQGCGVQ